MIGSQKQPPVEPEVVFGCEGELDSFEELLGLVPMYLTGQFFDNIEHVYYAHYYYSFRNSKLIDFYCIVRYSFPTLIITIYLIKRFF